MAQKENFEKLNVGKYANADVMYAALRTSEGEMVAALTSTPYDGNATAERRANRMARCWNEFDHYESGYKALKQGVYEVNIEPLKKQINSLEAVRDELLKSLEFLSTADTQSPHGLAAVVKLMKETAALMVAKHKP